MANTKLLFFDKKGDPLNYEYVGPTGPTPLDDTFVYVSSNSPSNLGDVDISSISSNQITLNEKSSSSYSVVNWAKEASDFLKKGSEVLLTISVLGTSQKIEASLSSVDVSSPASGIVINFSSTVGSLIISYGKRIFFETSYNLRPGGFFRGNAYFDPVSAGLFENFQVFVLQEFKDSSGKLIYGYPHSDINFYTSGGPTKWRTRWESNQYGNLDVSDTIFTYRIVESDPTADGDPIIYNYPNIIFEIPGPTGDVYTNGGYVETSENIQSALSLNFALNASEAFSEVYERKLIVEEILDEFSEPRKVLELDFYGQVIGEDERLDVLTKNLGRSFINTDSKILRNHDPEEPLPDYIEINEKRKELMIAGEEIFPYIGSYKGLINAIKFFGYQDLRVKEYWLNVEYAQNSLTPLQSTKKFLDEYKNQKGGYSQTVLIKDILDNPNSGKYRLVQTYGPNKNGEYVLDVSSENTLVPSNTFKKTSFFGLYYDLFRLTNERDEYGYPIAVDTFQFTPEEVIIKLFALKNRLKETYLPLNARIIDITGEGIYFNIYNSKSWTDSVDRIDIDSGFEIDFYSNPDFGFIEDLRAFYTRNNLDSILAPSNYDNTGSYEFNVYGSTADAFRVDGIFKFNPTLTLERGKTYSLVNSSDSYDLTITRDPFLGLSGPYGIENNGATGSRPISWYINPQEVDTLYYFSSQSPSKLNGVIKIVDPPVSDLGNIVDPLTNNQYYSPEESRSLIEAISNFYRKKMNGEVLELGDSFYDPESFIDPETGEFYRNPIGMPIILTLDVKRWTWDDLGVDWSSVSLPVMKVGESVYIKGPDLSNDFSYVGQYGDITSIDYPSGVYTLSTTSGSVDFDESSLFVSRQNLSLLNWKNIDFSTFVEIEWTISKSKGQPGSPYNWSFRGRAIDYYRLPHFLPYTGKYDVTCRIFDSYNFNNVKIMKETVEVSPRTIDIDAWTRYRENEFYVWQQTYRPWEDYDSSWEFPAEGKTYETLRKEFPSEVLELANYGNNSYEGQNVMVKVNTEGSESYGSFDLSQQNVSIESIKSYRIGSLSQYGYAVIKTDTPHGFSDGDNVFISGSLPDVNGNWQIGITSGATGYTFTIPKVLVPQSGVSTTLQFLEVDGYFYPNQVATGPGTISITIGDRKILDISSSYGISDTGRRVISGINKNITSPDYLASSPDHLSNPLTIKITADSGEYSLANGRNFDVQVTGSLTISNVSSSLTGGFNPSTGYVEWTEQDLKTPDNSLRLWGTKRFYWDSFTYSTWNNGYAHSWSDFEYNNEWNGGFSLYNIRAGDFLKVEPGEEMVPFPVGEKIPGVTGEGVKLSSLADHLNGSLDTNIKRFHYSVFPSSEYAEIDSLSGPTAINLMTLAGPTSSLPSPPSVPGSNSVNYPNFTYATGP